MVGLRKAQLVRHVWLNINLKPYNCRNCTNIEGFSQCRGNISKVKKAIVKLFSILSQWPVVEGAELTLELSVQSPSDKEHWAKNLHFGGDEEHQKSAAEWSGNQPFHDPKHGWINGRQVQAPDEGALLRIFEPVGILEFKESLPQVNAATRFIIRRQCRRNIVPPALRSIFDALPRLQSLTFEPWQFWNKWEQTLWDSLGYPRLIESHLPQTLKQISVFEETNEGYISLLQHGQLFIQRPDRVRVTSPAVSAAFAKRSLGLEKLSVAFMAEASDFFRSCQRDWIWSHMRSLTLTSRILTQTRSLEIQGLLENAAITALSMPHLHTMVIWNGRKGEAFKFFYRAETSQTRIGWRGIWDLKLTPSVIRGWQRVADKHTRHDLQVIPEPPILKSIGSHADAIDLLDLPSDVVHPVSVLQMQREAESSWYKYRT
ncbi:oxoglutarate iron-dependent oxygenase [Colletotrichum asianum]|uniref:Oxoglutarate iron-dependent oxygenase n=1 Tax=Colletotrichum asianum TaxID=702518 RepID=A0A8H3ZTI7_9PEZI|nr:oxoglutarate iron-dependent oxygenase [Colletotrichum asianum]